MTGAQTAAGGGSAARQTTYFFLSYAHTPPMRVEGAPDPDAVVGLFFANLVAAVAERAAAAGAETGFCDQVLRSGSNWRTESLDALGRAEVFVPLYAPRYFTSTLAGREWTLFHDRLLGQGVAEPGSRVVPVLWTPLPPGFRNPMAVDAPAEHTRIPGYRDDGLQTLHRLSHRREQYELVVAEVAERIVRLAQEDPVGPGAVPDDRDVEPLFPAEDADPPFTVLVAAPGAGPGAGAESGRGPQDPVHGWRPFAEVQELALAEYAAVIAARFGFACRVQWLTEKATGFEHAPGVVLIDECLAAAPAGRTLLEAATARLPSWALPLLVASAPGAEGVQRNPAAVQFLRTLTQPAPPELSAPPDADAPRRPARRVGTLREFEAAFPILVTESARLYLRDAPLERDGLAPTGRPRIFEQPPRT